MSLWTSLICFTISGEWCEASHGTRHHGVASNLTLKFNRYYTSPPKNEPSSGEAVRKGKQVQTCGRAGHDETDLAAEVISPVRRNSVWRAVSHCRFLMVSCGKKMLMAEKPEINAQEGGRGYVWNHHVFTCYFVIRIRGPEKTSGYSKTEGLQPCFGHYRPGGYPGGDSSEDAWPIERFVQCGGVWWGACRAP